MSKKDLILHVGMDKTGTTAIQHYLHSRRRRLESEDGILVPLTGAWSDHSHHLFAFAALGLVGRSPVEVSADLDVLFADLAREVAASAAPRVILSSECLFRLPGLSPDNPFWDHLARLFGRIGVVAYVRRQDKWVESRYRHSIVSGREIPLARLSLPAYCDYKRFIDDWAARLGRDAITVRAYERGQFAGGDIAQDFRQAIGLGPDEGGRSTLRNETFAWEDVLFRAAANHLDLPKPSLDRLNSVLLARSRGNRSNRTMISPEHAAALVAHYEEVNASIARGYLGRADGVLFREPPPPADPNWREPVLTEEGFAAILGFVSAQDGSLGRQIAAAARALPGEAQGADPAAALARLHDRLRAKAGAIKPAQILRRRDRPGSGRLFVHFGTRETGSASIQETLFAAQGSLPDTAYVSDGTTANASPVMRRAFMSESRLAAKAGSRLDPAVRRQDARQQLEAMCATAGDARRAILSAEAISDLGASQLAEMNGALAAHWPEISYVGYVRDPVSYARSAFQEQLKKGIGRGFAFAEGAGPTFSYHRVVKRLDALVGREAVQVFPFEHDLFPDGDVVRHFLEIVDLEEDAVPIRRVGSSLSATAVKALYCYRRLRVANDVEIGHNASLAAFVAAVAEIGGRAFALDAGTEALIAAANAHILDWSEARMGRRLRLPAPTAEGQGVGSEADLMRFDEAEMTELARWAGTQGLRAPTTKAGAEGVADLLASLRMRLAGKERSSPSLRSRLIGGWRAKAG